MKSLTNDCVHLFKPHRKSALLGFICFSFGCDCDCDILNTRQMWNENHKHNEMLERWWWWTCSFENWATCCSMDFSTWITWCLLFNLVTQCMYAYFSHISLHHQFVQNGCKQRKTLLDELCLICCFFLSLNSWFLSLSIAKTRLYNNIG